MDARWQLQDAKQRFSEVVRQAQTEGAQIVTRNGAEVVVVIDISEYRRLSGHIPDFRDYLRQPASEVDFEVERDQSLPRQVDLSDSR